MLDFAPQGPCRTKLMRPSGVDAVMQNGDPVRVARTRHVEDARSCWAVSQCWKKLRNV